MSKLARNSTNAVSKTIQLLRWLQSCSKQCRPGWSAFSCSAADALFRSTVGFILGFSVFGVIVSDASAAKDKSVLINGAGASFPNIIYQRWFSEYNRLHPSVKINYTSVGSGAGIRQLLARTVDFGASDAPMKDAEMKKADMDVLHIPTVLGAVVVSYNLPKVNQPIKLTPDILAEIFLGDIVSWDAKEIQEVNPDTQLPDTPIMVVRRSDGSGTTAVFTDYLSKVSPKWKKKVGTAKAVKWPIGLGGKGNEGVTGLIKQTPGAIGYVELAYAQKSNLSIAPLKNKAGQFVRPTHKSVSQAAAGALPNMPSDFRVSITNPSGKGAYPLAAFTYLLVYKKMGESKGKKLVEFLGWAMDEGQEIAPELSYSPLPKSMISKVKERIDEIEFGTEG